VRGIEGDERPLVETEGVDERRYRPLIVLVRHGSWSERSGSLTLGGVREVIETAEFFARFLKDVRRHGADLAVFYTQEAPDRAETRATAELIAEVLTKAGLGSGEDEGTHPGCEGRAGVRAVRLEWYPPRGTHGEVSACSPEREDGPVTWPNAYTVPADAENAVEATVSFLRRTSQCPEKPSITVLVSNDPFLGWVSAALRSAVHLGRGEMAGFEKRYPRRPHRWAWSLAWTLCHHDEKAASDLRNKIRSKMDTAKVFGALGVALLTFLLQQAAQGGDFVQGTWPLVGLLLIGAGTALYFATLFAYDRLLMPTRFWSARRPGLAPAWVVQRPPANDWWVLYQNMMHTWRWMFLPACLLIAGGLLALAFAAFSSRSPWWLAIVATAIAIVSLWSWRQRPRLGAED
jgi:hypothetical protein